MGQDRLIAGPFELVPGTELRREGKLLPVGHRALLLFEAIMRANGGVVSKTELIDQAWQGAAVEEGNLTVQISALRRELGLRPGGGEWIVTVPRVGYRLAADAIPAQPPAAAATGRPTLAVLPFVSLGTEGSEDYFADGLVSDLIAALSRFRSFAVVSRTSSFALRNNGLDARETARRLGVRYLLEGSVRLAGKRVRVTTQLIDAHLDSHLWAKSFDGELEEIFAFQDRITEAVAGLVEPQILRTEIERARRQWPESPLAYDHFLRALPHFYAGDPAGYMLALKHLERAIALEPDYALALAYASWTYPRRSLVALMMLSDGEVARCLDLAAGALRHGGDDPLVMAVCGHSLLAVGRRRTEGLAFVGRAMEENPNSVVVLMLGGICNMAAGDLDVAERAYTRAYTLSPAGMEAYECLAGIGFSHFFRGHYADAIAWLERSRATLVDWPPTYWILAAAQAHAGRMEEARETVARLLQIAPHTTLDGLNVLGARMDNRFQILADGLRRTGLT